MSKLAVFGGPPLREKQFPSQITVGREEKEAVCRVMDDTHLSRYRGNWIPEFIGGPNARKLEYAWAEYHSSVHAVAVNSCTSALQVSCGAVGLAPGDEVIVTPWSMTCSATAPLVWNAVPVFADVEEDYFCLDPKSVERRITPKTRAIVVVDLFGQPYNMEVINAIAKKHELAVIEDAAQAPGSTYDGKLAGTLGDIGCFSFTQGKHLTCGEGGMITTDNLTYAKRCQLIRNHAESVISAMSDKEREHYKEVIAPNMLGFNMRMTEPQATIIREQLKKLGQYIYTRRENADYFNKALGDIPAIEPAGIRPQCTHSYYVQAFKWRGELADGLHRDKFVRAVKMELNTEAGREGEGVPIGCGYIQPLYRMPLFRRRALYGGTPYPFNLSSVDYEKCVEECPVVERLWQDELFLWRFCSLPLTDEDRKDIVDAMHKVWEHRDELFDLSDLVKN
uniref:Putative DegT/DnrJ/EryC1/StrS aminotransferase family protein n=1 Tax=viral metagenome TaxID=1070528 RepID=A0A6M3JP40_9ZZZZ